MVKKHNHITVFEHEKIKLNQKFGDTIFDEHKLKSFQTFHGDLGVPYYSLIHNGIKFCEYVGVIQIGNTVIEVLPKTDRNTNTENDIDKWQKVLIDMLRAVGVFNIHAPSSSNLNLKSNSILDLYFELFLEEVEYLMHLGLIKKYRKTEGNSFALKGNLLFAQQIQKNLVHQERFYVRKNTYDSQHQLHQILYKTILLLKQINTNPSLQSKIGSLLLNLNLIELPVLLVF